MRPLGILGLLLTGCLLVGCGDSQGDDGSATDAASVPASSPSSSPAETPTGTPAGTPTGTPVGAPTTRILSETAAGGTTATSGVELVDQAAVASFNEQFTGTRLSEKVAGAVTRTQLAAGQRLYAAVVAVGCNVPTDVVVSPSDSGVEITAVKVTSAPVECFAPVTTVALVLVD